MSDFEHYRAKLLPGTKSAYSYSLPDVRPVTDGRKMTATITISTQAIDRSREVLMTDGGKLDNHRRNPVVLLAHKKDMPTGKAENRDTKEYSVKRLPGRLDATTYFDQHTELGEHGFRLCDSGTFRGASVGFFEVPGAIEKGHDGDGYPVRIIKEWDLLEYSHLLIPDNPECIIRAVEKGFGGKALNETLLGYLKPLIPERPVVVTGGWEAELMDLGDELETKEMADDVTPDELPDLTPSSQFYLSVRAKAMGFLGMVRELETIQETKATKAAAAAIAGYLGGVLDVCQKGHAAHVAEYPEQPDLESGHEQLNEWRAKAVTAWDEHLESWEKHVASEQACVVEKAVDYLRTLTKDRELPHRIRATAQRQANELAAVRVVKVAEDVDEATELAKLAAVLKSAKDDLKTVVKVPVPA